MIKFQSLYWYGFFPVYEKFVSRIKYNIQEIAPKEEKPKLVEACIKAVQEVLPCWKGYQFDSWF